MCKTCVLLICLTLSDFPTVAQNYSYKLTIDDNKSILPHQNPGSMILQCKIPHQIVLPVIRVGWFYSVSKLMCTCAVSPTRTLTGRMKCSTLDMPICIAPQIFILSTELSVPLYGGTDNGTHMTETAAVSHRIRVRGGGTVVSLFLSRHILFARLELKEM